MYLPGLVEAEAGRLPMDDCVCWIASNKGTDNRSLRHGDAVLYETVPWLDTGRLPEGSFQVEEKYEIAEDTSINSERDAGSAKYSAG